MSGALLLYLAVIPVLLSFLPILIPGNVSMSPQRVLSWIIGFGVITLSVCHQQFDLHSTHTSCTSNSLFPLAPLALDLPHYVRRPSLLYLSTLAWFVMPLHHLISSISNIGGKSGFENAFFGFLIPVFSLALAWLFGGQILMARCYTKDPPGLVTRVGVNLVLCGQLAVYAFELGLLSVQAVTYAVAAALFGVASLLYIIAWLRRHSWVSSRLLGGTGIEPIALMLPGRGPLYQSVGNEARQGPIHLV